MSGVVIRRLGPGDEALAAGLFVLMAEVFEEPHAPLPREYVGALLADPTFWAMAALCDSEPVAGLTAHTLPLTRAPLRELFIYDLAVLATWRRRGVASALLQATVAAAGRAGVGELFVAADVADAAALEFYRSQGGAASPVTVFTFPTGRGRRA